MSKYKAVIGLEMHCEIKSNAKVFSNSRNSYNEIPNINVNEVDLAFPGTLPIINKECVRKALLMSIVLNCKQPDYIYFDRKNYYYPDLPKGYQITQSHDPVGRNGHILIDVNGYEKDVLIEDIHLEEDAAAMDHFDDATLIDYNRAGVPLLEIVTKPCLNSAEEAVAFLEYMRLVYQYCDVSDADTKKGQIRCDVNVSIMDENDTKLGTKVEVKNVNSFSNVYKTINYEIERQSKLKEEGKYDEVIQETRRFDEDKGITIHMRSKVDAIDYKYFVEPNIPKYKINKEILDNIKKSIPMLPKIRKDLYINKYNIKEEDAIIITKNKEYAEYYEECLNLNIDSQIVANWLTGIIIAYLNKYEIKLKDFYLQPKLLKQIIDELAKKTISSKQAKEIFYKSLETKKEPQTFITKGMEQISDIKVLEEIIEHILTNNPHQIEAYKNGKTNIFDYFVGQVMKETKGKANPSLVKEILTKKLR